jgi:beta-1,4-mannosyl-glycoprotein beta-1,4-N-acetylglucosaminyltransferase
MAIYDCFQFFNEEDVLDIRLNTLSPFVDYFVIAESIYDHQGNIRELVFNKKKFNKFLNKIIYKVVKDIPIDVNKKHQGGHSLIEQYQRNAIMDGLENSNSEDLKTNWHGSRMCLKKNLRSPQWLRNIKFKKYPFWRIDVIRNLQIINDGGWHFSYLQDVDLIIKKIKSFSHGEYNDLRFINKNLIEKKINSGIDIFDRNIEYKKIDIDESFPEYILSNIEQFKKWII